MNPEPRCRLADIVRAPDAPRGTPRGFYGVQVQQCRDGHSGAGAYVTGYFYLKKTDSPAMNDGVLVGDRIQTVNGCSDVTATGLTNYLQHISPKAAHEIVVSRQIPSGQVVRKALILIPREVPPSCINAAGVNVCAERSHVVPCGK